MRVSVSNLELYRSWKQNEDQDFAWLVNALRSPVPTEPMLRGRAFARCLDRAALGECDVLSSDGYTFAFTGDFTIEHWPRREESREKSYGGVVVAARCDKIMGGIIRDDKSSERFDAEAYLEKFQSRYYLDIFDAECFVWNVWECKEIESKVYEVFALHTLTQYRYPEMFAECRDLAIEYGEFAARHGLTDVGTRR